MQNKSINRSKYVIFPIQDQSLWHCYKKLVDNFWAVTDANIKFDCDKDLKTLLNNFIQQNKYYYNIINDMIRNIEDYISNHNDSLTEAKFFIGQQNMMINTHHEWFSENSINFIENEASIKTNNDKVNWLKEIDINNIYDQIVALACFYSLMSISYKLINLEIESEALNRMVIDHELFTNFYAHLLHKLFPNEKDNNIKTKSIIDLINNSALLEMNYLIALGFTDSKLILNNIDCQASLLKQIFFSSLLENKKTKELNNNFNNLSLEEDF